MPSAPLAPLTIVNPGYYGLNTQEASRLIGPEWATEAMNAVFDNSGMLAARKGWAAVTTDALTNSPDLKQLAEYRPTTGSNQIISTAANKLYKGTTTLTDITGSVTVTADNWKFTNFNGNLYGLQTSHALVQYTGTGNFANVTAASGSVPTGNTVLGAFGRLWAPNSDGQTLKYSGLLDATNWGSTGAGSFNFTSVWGDGNDDIVALAQFNNLLVIFGRNNIIMLGDGTGSTLGMDPSNAYVQDMVTGIGCIARDSVQNINGDDLVFLSNSGVMSLRRVIQERSNPLRDISKNVRDALKTHVLGSTEADIRSVYSPRRGFYLLTCPTVGITYVFDTRQTLPDGTWRVTRWDSWMPKSLLCLEDGNTIYAGKIGKIFTYSGNLDVAATYRFSYYSGWLSISDEIRDRFKVLKRLSSIVYISGAATLIYKWAFDFGASFYSVSRSSTRTFGGSEWGSMEWGLGEWGGSVGLFEYEVPGAGAGQFVKIAVEAVISNTDLSLQSIELFAKIGRMT